VFLFSGVEKKRGKGRTSGSTKRRLFRKAVGEGGSWIAIRLWGKGKKEGTCGKRRSRTGGGTKV